MGIWFSTMNASPWVYHQLSSLYYVISIKVIALLILLFWKSFLKLYFTFITINLPMNNQNKYIYKHINKVSHCLNESQGYRENHHSTNDLERWNSKILWWGIFNNRCWDLKNHIQNRRSESYCNNFVVISKWIFPYHFLPLILVLKTQPFLQN